MIWVECVPPDHPLPRYVPLTAVSFRLTINLLQIILTKYSSTTSPIVRLKMSISVSSISALKQSAMSSLWIDFKTEKCSTMGLLWGMSRWLPRRLFILLTRYPRLVDNVCTLVRIAQSKISCNATKCDILEVAVPDAKSEPLVESNDIVIQQVSLRNTCVAFTNFNILSPKSISRVYWTKIWIQIPIENIPQLHQIRFQSYNRLATAMECEAFYSFIKLDSLPIMATISYD